MNFPFRSTRLQYTSRLLAALAILVAVLLGSAGARAGNPADDCSTGTIAITDVQPRQISNAGTVTLVVQGNLPFASTAVVALLGYGGLATTRGDPPTEDKVLHATVPAGVPRGHYTVEVINGDGTCETFSDDIKVIGPTPTPKPSETAVPTNTPGPTAFVRPSINVDSYDASSAVIIPGTDFDFEITLVNRGEIPALNVTAAFTSTSSGISPRDTGGVQTKDSLAPGETWRFFQPFRASSALQGQDTGTVTVNVTYFDVNAKSYTDAFTLTFALAVYITYTPTATFTPSPTAILSPRLLISDYNTGVRPVQPGDQFDLTLKVQNVGNALAKGITMIYAGSGTSGTSGNSTPGANADFGTFAPQNGSNLRFVGDLEAAQSATVAQTLVVNGSAAAGAYPLKFSFVYQDERGVSHTDDQVITALVRYVPKLEISFYQEPEPFVAGQSNLLPLQIVNHGLNSIVLGGMKVEGTGAQFKNNITLVGSLDAGSYFTLDALVIPQQIGPLHFTIAVDYTDAFNRSETITQTMQIQVTGSVLTPTPAAAAAGGQGGNQGGFLQTLWRAILGLFGAGG